MTEDDVAVLLNGYAAWNRGEFGATIALIHPEISWLPNPSAIEFGKQEGRESFVEFLESWQETFDDFRVQPELLVQKDDTAMVVGRQTGRGRGSGIEIGATVIHVWRIRDGRAIGFWAPGTVEEGLEGFGDKRASAVLQGYDAFNRGDLEKALTFFDPEIAWQTWIVPGPGGATYRGHEGILELWSDARNVFGDFRNVPERIIVAGDKVVAFVAVRGRGKESGAEVEGRIGHVHTFRGDLVVRIDSYEDRDEALRAAGVC